MKCIEFEMEWCLKKLGVSIAIFFHSTEWQVILIKLDKYQHLFFKLCIEKQITKKEYSWQIISTIHTQRSMSVYTKQMDVRNETVKLNAQSIWTAP